MKWDWIFFDADETLFTFDSFTGLQRMFLDYSVTFTAEDFQDYQAVNKPLWVDYQNGAITSLQLQHGRFESWAERLNVEPGKLNEAFINAMAEICTPLPGAVSLLNAIRGNAKIGIITNGFSALQQVRLERTGLRDYFDLLVISEEVGVAKPNKKIFDYALEQAGNPDRFTRADGWRHCRVRYSRWHQRRACDLLAECAQSRATRRHRAHLDRFFVARTGAAPV